MSQIEEIKKLYAKQKEYTIGKAKLVVTPLSLDELDLMDIKEGAPIKDVKENVKKFVAKSLGLEGGDVGIIDKVSIEYLKDLMDALMNANNFDEKDMKKTGIQDFIKKKQEQTKANE